MLKIATILLGLSIGVHPIELVVEEPVVRVRVLLDGREIAVLDSAPWEFDCDLGPELKPHELTVIGFDAEGKVVARDQAGVNLPRRLADDLDGAQLHLLREGGAGHPTAIRIDWNSLQSDRVTGFEASLNGVAIETDSLSRTPLPEYDPKEVQLLQIALKFADDQEVILERAFGGGIPADQIVAALTSVPVSLTDRKAEPDVADLGGHFIVADRELPVRTTELGNADIYVVVGPGSTPLPSGRGLRPGPRGKRPPDNPLRHKLVMPFPLDRGLGREGKGVLFPILDLEVPDHQVGQRIAGGRTMTHLAPVPQLADAVAVAGRLASGSGNRRAAVVLVGPGEYQDGSVHTIATVRRYLEALHVPLYVWSSRGGETPWGPSKQVDTAVAMNAGLRSVWKALNAQRIIWLEGSVPVHRVTIGESDLFQPVSAEPEQTKKKKKKRSKDR